jgi:glutamate synthase (NADPH/NADH) large chain
MVARRILDRWHDYMPRFVKIMPLEYKRVLHEQRIRETEQMLALIREEMPMEVPF